MKHALIQSAVSFANQTRNGGNGSQQPHDLAVGIKRKKRISAATRLGSWHQTEETDKAAILPDTVWAMPITTRPRRLSSTEDILCRAVGPMPAIHPTDFFYLALWTAPRRSASPTTCAHAGVCWLGSRDRRGGAALDRRPEILLHDHRPPAPTPSFLADGATLNGNAHALFMGDEQGIGCRLRGNNRSMAAAVVLLMMTFWVVFVVSHLVAIYIYIEWHR
jgi:hypothetical protein